MLEVSKLIDKLKKALSIKSNTNLSKRLGVALNTISGWKNRNVIPLDKLLTVSQNENISLDWLLNSKGEMFINNNIHACAADHFTVPCFDVDAAAGYGSIVDTCEKIDEICLSQQFIKENTSSSTKDLAFIKVSGNSMEPTLYDKDLILLDHSIITITNPGVYVFRHEGELFVKRLMKLGKSIINVISDNKTLYPAYQIDLSQEPENSFHILARAIYHCRKLK